jgi:hypothetical protein
MFFTKFWTSLTQTLHKITGLRQLQKKKQHILYGLSDLRTTPQQLANYLISLAKSTIYKTFLAAINNTNPHTANYSHMLRLQLRF